MSIVEVKNLTKVFGSGHTEVRAVDAVSLKIEAGDIVLIMGPSGSGKTTLISMIGTLLRPTKGQVLIDGKDTATLPDAKLADLRLHRLGFMFQSFNLLSALSAQQNVAVPLLGAGFKRPQSKQQAAKLLEHLHLGQRLGSLPRDLSGGEKQRVAIARALANNPKLILADEPTANLDSKTGHDVMQLLCDLACREGRAVVVVSHDHRLRDIAKRVITIADGRLLKEEPGDHNRFCQMHKTVPPQPL